jgi:transcriptional regulator with XRE-family HTH domain
MRKPNMTELRRTMRNADTNAFLASLNKGRLTLGQLLSSLREGGGESLASFANKLGVSRQHLHQIESGAKRLSPERAVRFARLLGQSETFFLQLVLQDLADDSGITANVDIKVA